MLHHALFILGVFGIVFFSANIITKLIEGIMLRRDINISGETLIIFISILLIIYFR
jgi:hypothetical protein